MIDPVELADTDKCEDKLQFSVKVTNLPYLKFVYLLSFQVTKLLFTVSV